MKDTTFIFAGNRAFVLEELLERKLKVLKIFVVENSYLKRFCVDRNLEFTVISSKAQLIQALQDLNFDVFLANGLPHILPISKLKAGNQKKFINVHPSCLPDLRGADPVPGALLFGKDSGATCHYMDDGIDTGDIISQVNIPMQDAFDAALLYRLSFLAERKAISLALDKNFELMQKQASSDKHIYYSFKETDLIIDFASSAKEITGKVKAFNTASKGAYFLHDGIKVNVWDAEIVDNDLLWESAANKAIGTVVMKYENNLLVKVKDAFVKLKQIKDITAFAENDNLVEHGKV